MTDPATWTTFDAQITGATRERTGFTTSETEGYINLSKFASPPVEIPPVGMWASITLDKDGRCRRIVPMVTPTRMDHMRELVQRGAAPEADSKDVQIARMKALELVIDWHHKADTGAPMPGMVKLLEQAETVTAFIIAGTTPSKPNSEREENASTVN